MEDIKASISTQPHPQHSTSTYTNVVRGSTEVFQPLTTKPTVSANTQERDIFVLLKNTNKSSPFTLAPATTLTDKANILLSEYFKNPSNGGLDILAQVHSTSHLANGSIILSFKTKEGAQHARLHADDWVKLIDPRATALHRTYAIIAHNVPVSIWSDPVMLREAIA